MACRIIPVGQQDLASNTNYRNRFFNICRLDEASHSWLNRYRKLLVRFEKTLVAHYALLCFAAANLIWQRVF
jgi:hypothetical protein